MSGRSQSIDYSDEKLTLYFLLLWQSPLIYMVCRLYVRLVVPELNETGKAPLVGKENNL